MTELLPATEELLVELLDGLNKTDRNLPELRISSSGRMGCRYWLKGPEPKSFAGRKPPGQFDELRKAGFLDKLRKESSGTYFRFTPPAFDRRDKVLKQSSKHKGPSKDRPSKPPPELLEATTRLQTLKQLEDKSRATLDKLLEVSTIRKRFENKPGDSLVVISHTPWQWNDLDKQDLSLLSTAKKSAIEWLDAMKLTLVIVAPERLPEFEEQGKRLRMYVNRADSEPGPPAGDVQTARQSAHDAFDKQLELLDMLPAAHEPAQTLIVPDTNSLLQDPEIEEWTTGKDPATIVIVPQVQSEIDDKKKIGNEHIKPKAQSLVKRFKEYSRRGDTFEGVPLKGPLSFKEVPIDPDMQNAPDWLDPDHRDDRILASALQLADTHLTSRVVLITRDRNFQNKARMARLPAVDVEDL